MWYMWMYIFWDTAPNQGLELGIEWLSIELLGSACLLWEQWEFELRSSYCQSKYSYNFLVYKARVLKTKQ